MEQPPQLKIAYIINGQLRIKDKQHANRINQLLDKGDVYLTTYPVYLNTSKYLKHKRLIVCQPPKLPQDGLYQYWTLQHTLDVYKTELQNYDVILRYRTDLELKINNLADYINSNFSSNDDKFYARTDWMFYCNAKLFINLFENVYTNITTTYINRERNFLPMNWRNLQSTVGTGALIRWGWLNYPLQYFPESLSPITISDNINKYIKELDELNNDVTASNIAINTFPRALKQRQSRPLSTEKFIVLYVTQKAVIYPINIPMVMPVPQVRNKWKL
jgi:hypothetical protein